MAKLSDTFTLDELRGALHATKLLLVDGVSSEDHTVARGIWMSARSNYEVQFQPDQELSERVIFPSTPSQRNGIEDARFVCFRGDNQSCTYFAHLRLLTERRWFRNC